MQKDRVINGRKYTIHRLPFGMGESDKPSIRSTLSKLAKMADRDIGLSIYSADTYFNTMLMTLKGALRFIARADDPNVQFVLQAFGGVTVFDNKFLTVERMDEHFSMYPSDFAPWFMDCMEVQFSDFLGGFFSEEPRLMKLFQLSGLQKSNDSQTENESELSKSAKE